ncbi:MAG TPA: helix-turn-helix transcriptional regulator [Burkholderiales bacterium]
MPSASLLARSLAGNILDGLDLPATAKRIEITQNDCEQPLHRHRHGHLVIALAGAVTCHVPGGKWVVPPQSGVWVPAGILHSSTVTHNARICFLYVQPHAAKMPGKCCTVSLSPLLLQLIQYLADQGPSYPRTGPTARLVKVLLDQLVTMPIEQLHLPVSDDPTITRIANELATDPSDRSTLAQWARRVAMSERTLARLVNRETGLTFGRWRQQLHLIIALHQLASGCTVQQVAGHLGYGSVTAFITMFKKLVGHPPGRYIANLR